MANDIQAIDPSGDGGVSVIVGGVKLPLRQFQDLFAELGSSNDSTNRQFTKPFILNYDQLKNLYQRLSHYISNLHAVASKTSITVNHLDDDVQEFPSYEKFQLYNQNNHCPITSITLAISFVLKSPILPAEKLREYSFEIHLNSGAARIREAEEQRKTMPDALGYRLLPYLPYTAFVTAKYVDYSIAVSMISIVEAWIKSLPEVEKIRGEKVFTSLKQPLVYLTHLIVSLSTALILASTFKFFFPNVEFILIIAIFLAVMQIANRAAYEFADILLRNIINLRQTSIILMNSGDEQIKIWYNGRRQRSLLTQVGSGLASLTTMVISAFVSYVIFGR